MARPKALSRSRRRHGDARQLQVVPHRRTRRHGPVLQPHLLAPEPKVRRHDNHPLPALPHPANRLHHTLGERTLGPAEREDDLPVRLPGVQHHLVRPFDRHYHVGGEEVPGTRDLAAAHAKIGVPQTGRRGHLLDDCDVFRVLHRLSHLAPGLELLGDDAEGENAEPREPAGDAEASGEERGDGVGGVGATCSAALLDVDSLRVAEISQNIN